MLDHVGFAVADVARSRSFYQAALASLGIRLLMEFGPAETESGGTAIGFGCDNNPFFWVGDYERVGEGTHVAFTARSRAEVDAFHAAAIAAGGQDNARRGCGRIMGPITSQLLSMIRTASMWKQSATHGNDQQTLYGHPENRRRVQHREPIEGPNGSKGLPCRVPRLQRRIGRAAPEPHIDPGFT